MVRSDKRRTEERTQAYERKTEKKEVPAVAVPEAEERNPPTVKVEMKGKKRMKLRKRQKAGTWKIRLKNGLKRTALSL